MSSCGEFGQQHRPLRFPHRQVRGDLDGHPPLDDLLGDQFRGRGPALLLDGSLSPSRHSRWMSTKGVFPLLTRRCAQNSPRKPELARETSRLVGLCQMTNQPRDSSCSARRRSPMLVGAASVASG